MLNIECPIARQNSITIFLIHPVEDWKTVLFVDESKFEIHGNNRRIYVRRRPGERLSSQCIKPTVKHGGGNIQVWGCFSCGGSLQDKR